MCKAVLDAADYLPTPLMDAAEPMPWPARMEQLAHPVV